MRTRTKQQPLLMRAAATLLLALLTATTTWADDVTLSVNSDIAEGTAGHYYVNMPATGTNTLTLSDATVTTFKIYDDGGKDGNYSNGCSGYLTLTAPTGYVLQLSGSIATGKNWDKLTVYDGSTTSVTKLLDAVSSTSDGTETAITTVVSSGQSMTLYFYSDGGYNYAGLDLTVTLVNPNAEYGITVNNASGGSVASDKSTAKFNDEVTLTATPSEGYLFSGLSVTDASNNAVAANGGWYTNNQATFTMPGSAVTVTPTFTNDLTNLYINMPAAGTKTATIPTGVQSFKVYDDGGASGRYSDNCSGTLTLTAPEGYVLQLSGSIKTQSSADYLTVYDNSAASGTKLLNAVSSTSSGTETAITTVVSSGQSMKLYFYSNGGSNYAGLDLTVTLVNPNAEYGITVGNATGGSVAATVGGQSASTAKENDVVTLTATPSVGYLFSGISVTDASGNAVEVDWSVWTNTATFTMPASAVTVTPTFTNDLTNLYINMPAAGTKTATIPTGVQSFKVYDDGGASGRYSNDCSGTLTLTAPEGYVLQLSGSITTETNYDYLTVYDNSAASGTKLLDEVSSTSTAITTVVSSGQSMTLYFYSDHGYNYAGLDLTVTLFSTSTEYAITVGNATGGSVAATVGGQSASTAKVNDVVTLTATPTNGYLLSDISVTDASSNAVAVAWDIWTNTATFTMPVSAVTVTPTFTNTWTADGGLYVNMPKSGTKTATIPSGVQSFKVYDDGGASSNYSDNCSGTLTLTAPEGYVLQLSGSITTETYDKLTVYNGGDSSASKLLDAVSGTGYGTETDITTVVSSGQSMTLYFYSYGSNYAGLDLTVTLFSTSTEYAITVGNATGGSVAATVGGQSASTAKVNDVVTLTATPTNGYLLSDISVTDASSNAVAVAWDTWTNTATFTMPVSAVTVTPTFTNTWTADGGLYVNMPKSGTKTATIPSGVQSFKVYDDGGASGYYSNIYDGTLVLTAPAGYVLQLSGSITTETDCDKLTVYNGTSDSDPKLIDAVSSTSYGTETDITTVVSSGQSMTLYFNSDDIYSYAGLDLTVTLVPITYTVSFNANGGSGDTMAAQNFTYDAAQTLTANSYTRTGYTFAGWATTADGDVVYTDQQSVSNLTTEPNGNVELYAKWTPSGNISLTTNAHDGNLWTTFYCGDAGYTIDDAENACAYTAEVGTSEVVLHRLGKVIPQGTAVIIVGQDDEISMTISSETVDAMPANHLRGLDVRTATADVISSIVGADALYMMSKQGDEFGFFRYEGTNVPARKAFLALNNSQAALARGFQMVFDDEATGISTTDFTDYTDGADAWYSLDGRKLAGKPTQRGIYVNNGKKIVIK